MTIDEKLQHFMDVTTEKVNAENAKQMQEYEQGLEKVYEDYKETALRKSELALKLKEESLKKQMNADLAAAKVTGTNKDESGPRRPAKRESVKIYPNDPCPCGSGKKYKNCCGKNR